MNSRGMNDKELSLLDVSEELDGVELLERREILRRVCNLLLNRKFQSVSVVSRCYEYLPTPLHDFLFILTKCCYRKKPVTNETMNLILTGFARFMENASDKLYNVDESLRRRAFTLATAKHVLWFDSLSTLYQFESSKEMCVFGIRAMIGYSRHLDAAKCILQLKLYNEFSIEEIYLPLVFIHAHRHLYNCLESNPSKLKELLGILDADLKNGFQNIISQYILKDSKQEFRVIHGERFMKQTVKNFDLNPYEVTPYFASELIKRSIRFYTRQRYKAKELPANCYSELLELAMANHPGMRKFIVSEVFRYGDFYEGHRLIREFRLPRQMFSNHLFRVNVTNALVLEQDLPLQQCLRLPPEVQIKFVRDEATLIELVQNANECGIVALDSEWTPEIGFVSAQMAALLQLCVGNKIYLIELDVLKRHCSENVITDQLKAIFCQPSIKKLTFDFHQDINALVAALPFCGAIFLSVENLHCIKTLTKKQIIAVYGEKNIPNRYVPLFNQSKGSGGLKHLCNMVLGKDLDKRQRVSVWSRRPLRPEQIEYAALDVYSVMEIYNVISTMTADGANNINSP